MTPPKTKRKKKRLRVLLAGYGSLGLGLFEGLYHCDDCEVIGVFCWSDRTKGRRYSDADEKKLKKRLKELEIPTIRCPGINAYPFVNLLNKEAPDVLLLGSWGEIIKPHILELPDIAVINCHPSKLPAHRGANPYTSAIRSGETESGITFHKMVEDIDAGPIILQKTVPIKWEDTGSDLRDRCSKMAQESIAELIPILKHRKRLKRPKDQEQDHALKSYFPPLKWQDGEINWTLNPEDIYNQVRGLQPWLDSFSFIPMPWDTKSILSFERITLQKNTKPSQAEPGTIVKKSFSRLHIATSNPAKSLIITNFKLYLFNIPMPCWLSNILGLFFMQPGSSFVSS